MKTGNEKHHFVEDIADKHFGGSVPYLLIAVTLALLNVLAALNYFLGFVFKSYIFGSDHANLFALLAVSCLSTVVVNVIWYISERKSAR